MAKTLKLFEVHSFPPHLIYVNALPCETNVPNGCKMLMYFPSKCCNDLINVNYLAEL